MDDEERGSIDGSSDNPSAPAPMKRGNWGVRGVSVSVDEVLVDPPGKDTSPKPYGDG